ncbi:MAG: DnaJ domain-containing protein, partial [Sulfuricella sp.]|nr:DnaJ domain-containing protein [Sulfuricella sp.]
MSLAWACYRDPLRIQGKSQGSTSLPDGLSLLLRIAAGDKSQMETLCAATGASASQLREAAIFFVKQVFFSGDANHYRVLGVDSDASIDQIKEHHRLLMHLFHPDREGTEESWEDVYATRVNQSYNVLRKSESRQQYDAALKITAQQKSIPLPVRRKHYYASQSQVGKPDSSGIRLPLVVARNLPQFVLGGMAVLAFSVIYLVYLPGAGDV